MPRRKRVRGGSGVARGLLGVGILLSGLAIVWLGLQVVVSGFGLWQAELFLDDWRAKGSPPGERAAAVASEAAERAVERFPVAHADLLLVQGEVLAWQTWAAPVADPGKAVTRRAALAAYRAAVVARPEHSRAWVGIARLKRELGEIDAGFETALVRSVETAPWRVAVLRQVSRLGVREWERMGPRGRYATVLALARGIASGEREARTLAALLGDSEALIQARERQTGDLAAVFSERGPAGILARVCLTLQRQGLGEGYGLCG